MNASVRSTNNQQMSLHEDEMAICDDQQNILDSNRKENSNSVTITKRINQKSFNVEKLIGRENIPESARQNQLIPHIQNMRLIKMKDQYSALTSNNQTARKSISFSPSKRLPSRQDSKKNFAIIGNEYRISLKSKTKDLCDTVKIKTSEQNSRSPSRQADQQRKDIKDPKAKYPSAIQGIDQLQELKEEI